LFVKNSLHDVSAHHLNLETYDYGCRQGQDQYVRSYHEPATSRVEVNATRFLEAADKRIEEDR